MGQENPAPSLRANAVPVKQFRRRLGARRHGLCPACPLGIDIRKVVETGFTPMINTGIDRRAGWRLETAAA